MFVKVSVTVAGGFALGLRTFAEQAFEIMLGSKDCKAEGVLTTDVELTACLFCMICEKSSVVAVVVTVLITVSVAVTVSLIFVNGVVYTMVVPEGVTSVEALVE